MVRLKHRYLLLSILYPPTTSTPAPPSSKNPNASLATQLQTHAPTPPTFTAATLLRLLRAQISALFGDYGVGTLGGALNVKYFSNATSTAIVRCPRDGWRMVGAAVAAITEIPGPGRDGGGKGKGCVVRVLRVCGTIRKAEEEGVKRARILVGQVKSLGMGNHQGEDAAGGEDLQMDVNVDEDEDDEMWEDSDNG
ncbi:MAG: hypothetical protein Q9227_006099 [Pyrenula ochraceoflavens]